MQSNGKALTGHLLALSSVVVWGSTFIFSKILLEAFSPLQVMVMRFVIAFIVLWCLHPRREATTPRDELGIFIMSLFGNTLYFLCENNALRYTLAANVSIIVAMAPICTAVLARFLTKGSRLGKNVLYGFLLAFTGVALVVFNGTVVLKFNPLGDMLSFGAAVSWALYSIMVERYNSRYTPFFLMRRLTMYGLITALPIMLLADGFAFPIGELMETRRLFSIIFLGVLGSGVSYVTWNMGTRALGVIRVNNYIYVNPFVTMLTAGLFLGEPITLMGFIGAALIIGGVIVGLRREKGEKNTP